MASILDYVRWRGDLRFSQDPLNEVDAVVFSALSYVHYSIRSEEPVLLRDAAEAFFAEGNCENRIRVKSDLELLALAADSVRFGQSRLFLYQDLFVPEQETQFAAMTFLLDDGTLFVAFRGTDGTLVGWKEDFNMTFQQSVPSQRLALSYVREVALERTEPMYLGGHSKGGNMAVFAASRSSPMIQERILGVYNNDGPGFTKYMMGDPGYLAILGRIHTFIPQSSVIGMLLEHEEPYTIVRSKTVSVWQHDLYSWELIGKRWITMEAVTQDSIFLDATIKTWFASMSNKERNQLVDSIYGLISTGGADRMEDLFQLKNMHTYLKRISADESLRKLLSTEFLGLIQSARSAYARMEEDKYSQRLLQSGTQEDEREG